MSRNIIDEGNFVVNRCKGLHDTFFYEITHEQNGWAQVTLTEKEFLGMCVAGLRDYVEGA